MRLSSLINVIFGFILVFVFVFLLEKGSVSAGYNEQQIKELYFNVKVVGLRAATKEELKHGHAHSAGHDH